MAERNSREVDLLIEGGIVITMDTARRIYDPGYVGIKMGAIAEVGPAATCALSANRRLDASGMVVLPGIVNPHNHLDQSVYRSCLDQELASRNVLLEMARGLTRNRARAAAAITLLEQVHYGVTTTQESHWTHYHLDSTDGVCEAIQQSGMRAVVGRCMKDKEEYTPADFCERIDDVLEDLDRLEQLYESEHIHISAEAGTMLQCTPETILALREWALERGKMWHIHLAQNREELSEALRTVGMGSVQYAERLGVLGPDMLAIHCSGILDEEVELLGKFQVRIAHCPAPIMRHGGKVPPIWDLQKLGAVVAIGTDGSATTNGQNPWEAMKMAVYMQRVRTGDQFLGTAEKALEMATITAARVLRLDDRIGSLEVGKQADMALFRRDQFHLVTDARLVNNLVYSGVPNLADTVLVGGRVLLEGGSSTVFDEEEVRARAREAQAGMIRDANLQDELGLTFSWPVKRRT